MNGNKTIEVRKNKALASAIQKLIDENGYADIYVYCTKAKEKLMYDYDARYDIFYETDSNCEDSLNGKVVFKFRCYKVEEILIKPNGNYYTNTLSNNKLLAQSCLSQKEIFEYTSGNWHISKSGNYWYGGYAIHINDLEIFDKPKELSEFYKVGHYEDLDDYFTDEKQINGKWCIPLTKAPQNFCYVEVE